MGWMESIVIGNGHYEIGWDICDGGMMQLRALLDTSATSIDTYKDRILLRIFVSKSDVDKLIAALIKYRNDAFGDK